MEDTAVVPNYEGKGKDCYVTAKEENNGLLEHFSKRLRNRSFEMYLNIFHGVLFAEGCEI